MKIMLVCLFYLISIFSSDFETKGPIGNYKVEFYNNYDPGYIIKFRENDYSKINSKGETIGKGAIFKHLSKNGEGIIHLKEYIIAIPAGRIDKPEHKSFSKDYTQIWFSEKDTIQFGIHHDNDDPHFAFKSGRMIKIKEPPH
jgi:hypothetical protein